MVPVLSIPALAIFGIPQFAPVVASPLEEGSSPDRERRVGQSARAGGDGFLSDLEDAPSFGSEPVDRADDVSPGRPGDSVSLPRNHRSFPSRIAAASTEIPDQSEPVPRWEDNGFEEMRVAQAKDFGDSSTQRPGEPANIDLRDARFESRQAGLGAKVQPVSNPNANGIRGPQVYQRQRDSVPDQIAQVRPAASESEPLTWRGAVRKLNELEIRNFRLQPGHRDNEFVFICSYTPSDSPRVSYRFEAEADEPLKAVEKVLEQIAEWQQRK
jgi:hypothetical protein